MTQQAEITFEIEETITLRAGEIVLRAFCPFCQTVVEVASSQLAAAVTDTPIREVFRQIETGNVADTLHSGQNETPFITGENKNEEK
jgi:hypothetical protein